MTTSFPPVAELVPQRPPMLLLDAVEQAWDDGLCCTATVRADWLLVIGEAMPAAGLLEIMAQTVAAWHGLRGRSRGEPVRVGMLVGCRDLQLHAAQVPVGACLRVVVRQSYPPFPEPDGGLLEFACRIELAGQVLAEGLLQVMRGQREAQPA